jgi:glyoxylase-like metal-dependent hydrolase (beta-lactamase superfamily II)
MNRLTDEIYRLENLRGSNVYLLAFRDELVLIDCGLPADFDRIRAQLEQAGYALSQLSLIVLTHGHGDHAGAAARLKESAPAEIAAHPEEIPYLRKEASLPFRSLLKKALFWLADQILLPQPALDEIQPAQEGDRIEAAGGLEVIHTPGHTPGSISLFQPERRILFCGDALFLAHPLTGKSGLRLPPNLVTADPDRAYRSAEKILALEPEILCPGHGQPLTSGAAGRLRKLLEGSA